MVAPKLPCSLLQLMGFLLGCFCLAGSFWWCLLSLLLAEFQLGVLLFFCNAWSLSFGYVALLLSWSTAV
jgi:hypothetical protein